MMAAATTPLFLSRLLLNPRSRQVMSEMAHPYEMHRTLMRGFPEANESTSARAEFGILFRADVNEERGTVTVYVQSSAEPDWLFLRSLQYLRDKPDPPKNLAPVYEHFQVGQVLRFRLRANPSKRIAKPYNGKDELKGKRVGLLSEREQIAWLMRKGQERLKDVPGGFEILTRPVPPNTIGETGQLPCVTACTEGKLAGRRQQQALTHLAVRFDGLLRITDPHAFRQTLISGIGPAKAFGFGLLSLASAV